MSSGFLLLETVPGREAAVLEALGQIPAVTHRSLIFPAAIAVKLEAPAPGWESLAARLRRLEGVVASRLYPAKNN